MATMATRIYVGNLPHSAINEQVSSLIGALGRVAEAISIPDRDTGQAKALAFVQMGQAEAARTAITASRAPRSTIGPFG
jgi:RNA recognition motif-containing protein